MWKMEKLTSWLKSEKTPRWWLIIAVLIPVLGLAGTQYFFWNLDQNHEKVKVLERKIDKLQNSSVDFQAFVAAYANAIMEQSDKIEEAHARLLENINRQDAQLRYLSQNLDSAEIKIAARQYHQALVNLSDVIPKSKSVLTMAEFWNAISDVLIARDEYLKLASTKMQSM